MIWSLATLLRSVCSSTTNPLPFRITVEILFLIPISSAEWLNPTPPRSLRGSSKHTTSALRLTHVFSAAMVHSYKTAQLCWIALIIGSLGSRLNLSSSRDRSCTLGHCNLFCLPRCLRSLCIHQFRSASPPCLCSSVRPQSKHHSVRPWCHASGCVRRCPPCWPYSLTLLRRLGSLSLLWASVAQRNVIPFAVGALLQHMTTEWSQLRCAPHHVALVVACLVMTWAVATCRLAATFVLDVTPSTAALTSAVRARVRVRFDSVPHFRHLIALPDQAICHLAPLSNENNQWCGDLSVLPPLPDGAGIHQAPYLSGDCYALILCFKFLAHLLQAFGAFSHGPYERYCMDLSHFRRLISFDINDFFVESPHGRDDNITASQTHLGGRILVRHCCGCALGASSCVQDPNVGRGLLEEKLSVDCQRNFLVHLIGGLHALVSLWNWASLCHAWSSRRGGAWAGGRLLTLPLGLDCLPPSGRIWWWLRIRFRFVLHFRQQCKLQFGCASLLLLQQVALLVFSILRCVCMLWGLWASPFLPSGLVCSFLSRFLGHCRIA